MSNRFDYDRPSTSRSHEQYSSRSHPYRREREDRLVERKEVERPVSFDGLPTALRRLMGSLHCRLCAVETNSEITARTHYNGKSHAKKVSRFLERYSREKGLPMPEGKPFSSNRRDSSVIDYCQICQVTFSSEHDKKSHYSGKSHRELERNPPKVKSNQTLDHSGRLGKGDKSYFVENTHHHICEICSVKAICEEQLRAHLSGKRHQENLEKQKTGRSGVSSEDKPYACDICDVAFESRTLYEKHLNGRRHSKSLMRLECEEGDNYCEICDIPFTSFEHYDSHVKGRMHKKMCMKGCDLRIEEEASIACKYCPYIGNVQNHECDRSLAKRFEKENLEGKIVCHPCSMIFGNEEELEAHKTSRRHVLIALNKQGDLVVEHLKFWYCIVCRKQYRNNREYTEHLFGETHMSAANQDFVPDAKTNLFQCPVCDLILDVEVKEDHEKDKKHIEKGLRKDIQESIRKLAKQDLKTQSFFCNNCDVRMDGLMKYSEHLLSASHIDKLVDRILNNSK